MTLNDIANYRLAAQQISGTNLTSAKAIVAHLGAMQAQDYSMAKWAVGVRLPGSVEREIEEAVNKGEIIRTHAMRPTWHFVAANDVYWMLELAAPNIKRLLKVRHKQLEITPDVLKKCYRLLEKQLYGGKHRSRQELNTAFTQANISISDNRASHILMEAELDGLICSGNAKGKKTTYALLPERVPKPPAIPRDEALAKLAQRYFSAHGPATLHDFIWWSGLSAADAKRALEMVKPTLQSVEVETVTYWFAHLNDFPSKNNKNVYLLPAFDEYVISYQNRSAVLSAEGQKTVVSKNGIFWPVIIADGKAVGLWRRTFKKDKLMMEMQYFPGLSSSLVEKLQKKLQKPLVRL